MAESGRAADALRARLARMDAQTFTVRALSGDAILPWLDAVAELRMTVFREWPYLYAGDVGYERDYLSRYGRSARSVLVLAMVGDALIGASTGLPLADEDPAFQRPFVDLDVAIERVFYFGESIVLPQWRGQGIGHRFFDLRQAHARALGGFDMTAFAAVDRAEQDPRRPPNHRDNEVFWRKRGYVRQPGMTMLLRWNEIDVGDVPHPMTFWTRPVEAGP